jgi:hypothetical protein
MAGGLLPGVPFNGSEGPQFAGMKVPELHKAADTEPADLRAMMAERVRAAMIRAGMGADHSFEMTAILHPQNNMAAWLLIIVRKTGLPGDKAYLAAPGVLAGGFPTKDDVSQAVQVLQGTISEMHRAALTGLS